jgi:hypothetical protein
MVASILTLIKATIRIRERHRRLFKSMLSRRLNRLSHLRPRQIHCYWNFTTVNMSGYRRAVICRILRN